jgi:hypothetical protein
VQAARVRETNPLRGIIVSTSLAFLLPACGAVINEIPASATERVPDAWVGAVDERLFIALAVVDANGPGDDPRLTAYLCDGDAFAVWLTGSLTEGEATLTVGDTRIELATTDDGASGSVVVAGGQPQPFTAVPAIGEAGLYRLAAATDGGTPAGGWIVLNDGRQRGLDAEGNPVRLTF